MYTGHGFESFTIGDIDVVWDGEKYHLFHLVLPNHDYIAHATSDDGLVWDRVPHALFIDNPGAFDDDMLWTMHVTPDPHRGGWRMMYTGLKRAEQGRIQRVGAAHSPDLYHWTKLYANYPLEISGEHYEAEIYHDRRWVSFRDPFLFHENSRCYLLASGRVNEGPEVRRGCVALAEEVGEDEFSFRAPLHWPRHYDEIEVPGLIKIDGRYFLIGSLREDVKVRYWYASELEGPYENFFDNVLMPQGNYAARPMWNHAGEPLVWSFFFRRKADGTRHQMLPPPKRLAVMDDGRLALRSCSDRFDKRVIRSVTSQGLAPLEKLMNNPHAEGDLEHFDCWVGCKSGFEALLLQGEYDDFRLRGTLAFEGLGKAGLVFRVDDEGNGYHLSLDLIKGLAQVRAWGVSDIPGNEEAFRFGSLQPSNWVSDRQGPWDFELIAFGSYLEFSINGCVELTLGDDCYRRGRVGFYVESSKIKINNLKLEELDYRESPELAPSDRSGMSASGTDRG
jgi:beta-fructofuranosidase